MDRKQQRELIISLIKDNLINTKLVLGLNNLGLNAGDYHLSLSNTILNVSGVTISDEKFEAYQDLFKQATEIDMDHPKQLNKTAEKIYKQIIKLK